MSKCQPSSSLQRPQVSIEGEVEKGGPQSEDTADGRPKETAAAAAAPVNGDGAVRWYERAYDYWEDGQNCPPDDDGVLGGYGHISPTDVAGSGAFLDELQSMRPLLGNTHAAGGAAAATAAVTCVCVCVACGSVVRGNNEREARKQAGSLSEAPNNDGARISLLEMCLV